MLHNVWFVGVPPEDIFLQMFEVDSDGCTMIERKKKEVESWLAHPTRVAELVQERVCSGEYLLQDVSPDEQIAVRTLEAVVRKELEDWRDRLDNEKAVLAMQSITHGYKINKKALVQQHWKGAVLRFDGAGARWPSLEEVLQGDLENRTRLLYYWTITKNWFESEAVDVLIHADHEVPCFSSREKRVIKEAWIYEGVEGTSTTRGLVPRASFPEAPTGFEWGCGFQEKKAPKVASTPAVDLVEEPTITSVVEPMVIEPRLASAKSISVISAKLEAVAISKKPREIIIEMRRKTRATAKNKKPAKDLDEVRALATFRAYLFSSRFAKSIAARPRLPRKSSGRIPAETVAEELSSRPTSSKRLRGPRNAASKMASIGECTLHSEPWRRKKKKRIAEVLVETSPIALLPSRTTTTSIKRVACSQTALMDTATTKRSKHEDADASSTPISDGLNTTSAASIDAAMQSTHVLAADAAQNRAQAAEHRGIGDATKLKRMQCAARSIEKDGVEQLGVWRRFELRAALKKSKETLANDEQLSQLKSNVDPLHALTRIPAKFCSRYNHVCGELMPVGGCASCRRRCHENCADSLCTFDPCLYCLSRSLKTPENSDFCRNNQMVHYGCHACGRRNCCLTSPSCHAKCVRYNHVCGSIAGQGGCRSCGNMCHLDNTDQRCDFLGVDRGVLPWTVTAQQLLDAQAGTQGTLPHMSQLPWSFQDAAMTRLVVDGNNYRKGYGAPGNLEEGEANNCLIDSIRQCLGNLACDRRRVREDLMSAFGNCGDPRQRVTFSSYLDVESHWRAIVASLLRHSGSHTQITTQVDDYCMVALYGTREGHGVVLGNAHAVNRLVVVNWSNTHFDPCLLR